jgi:acyl-coenzyme A synthetase/AMP-(fatty) acid ligase
VQVDKHWRVLALYLACLRAGLVYLPLNTGYQKAELQFFFEDASPRVIVCRPESLGTVATIARRRDRIDARLRTGGELADRAVQESPAFETVFPRPDDLAAILYTSGTTGRSKGARSRIAISHRMRWRSWKRGASRAATCCCTHCRSTTCTAVRARSLRALVRRAHDLSAEVRRARRDCRTCRQQR